MNPDRWQRTRTLFEAAIKLPPAEIENFLHLECGADNNLREQLQGMLREHAAGTLSLSRSASASTGTAETVADIPTPAPIGTRLKDRYLIRRELGRGGFGVVYLATDEQLLSKKVVVKLMADAEPDPWRRRKFLTEIEALARLNHPGIVSVSDSGETADGRLFLVMEYVEGAPLRSLLKPGGMEFERAANMLRQMGRALDSAHRNGIWHRDLKPENIMVQTLPDGEQVVKIIDFGIATVTDSDGTSNTSIRVVGTMRYMAPEQLRGRPGAESDIYSLGVIACEMLTGKPPFPADNVIDLHFMQMALQQPQLRTSRPDLPPDAERCILRAIEFEAAERYPTVIAFTTDLVHALQPATLVQPSKNYFGRGHKLRTKLLLIFAAVLLLTAAGAFAFRTPHLQTSMVVFQIDDLSSDPAYRPLSAGLTGALVSRLTRVDGLNVKQYYGTRANASSAVIKDRFYLDGDLQKYENQIRLTMRLSDADKGNAVVWSNSFDHDLDNPLVLESEVSQRVVEGLQNRVFSEAPEPVRVRFKGSRLLHSVIGFLRPEPPQPPATQSPAAYQAYIRGRELYEERTPAAVRSSIESFNQAVSLDPSFALAWAALADAYRALIDGKQGPQEELLAKSLTCAEKAVKLNPKLPEAYAALAGVQQMQWDWQGAEQSYREAIRLDPKSPVAYRRYGGLRLQFGDFRQALEYTKKGLELDPYDYPSHVGYAVCLMLARRYPDAEDHLKWTLSQRDLISAHNDLGSVYALRGREATGDEAKRYFDLALIQSRAVHDFELQGSSPAATSATPVSDSMYAEIYALKGDRIQAHRYLDRLLARPEIGKTSPASLASIYCALGENATALTYLRQAALIKDRGLLYLKVDPTWDSIRETEGYRQILLTMHL